jgi:hypothetical protein
MPKTKQVKYHHVQEKDFNKVKLALSRGLNQTDIRILTGRSSGVVADISKCSSLDEYRKMVTERNLFRAGKRSQAPAMEMPEKPAKEPAMEPFAGSNVKLLKNIFEQNEKLLNMLDGLTTAFYGPRPSSESEAPKKRGIFGRS